jgi:DNA-directed RNA polymerase specialized sigma24 family protein
MHDAASGGSNKSRNPDDLTRLLLRFDPDATRAWEKYDNLRRRLAKFFGWNRCTGPEDLADEVLDRVAAKSSSEEILEIDKYSFGVARFICLEAHKKMQHETHSEDLPSGENTWPDAHNLPAEIVDRLYQERRLACLRQCLASLMPGDRELVIQYYSAEEEKQKTFRRKLAEKAGLKLGTLRVRTNRLREQFEGCVKRCLEARQQKRSSVL